MVLRHGSPVPWNAELEQNSYPRRWNEMKKDFCSLLSGSINNLPAAQIQDIKCNLLRILGHPNRGQLLLGFNQTFLEQNNLTRVQFAARVLEKLNEFGSMSKNQTRFVPGAFIQQPSVYSFVSARGLDSALSFTVTAFENGVEKVLQNSVDDLTFKSRIDEIECTMIMDWLRKEYTQEIESECAFIPPSRRLFAQIEIKFEPPLPKKIQENQLLKQIDKMQNSQPKEYGLDRISLNLDETERTNEIEEIKEFVEIEGITETQKPVGTQSPKEGLATASVTPDVETESSNTKPSTKRNQSTRPRWNLWFVLLHFIYFWAVTRCQVSTLDY
ncbi:unnamed protein product [Dicrocoelium dendriticum]|nr:unnamed protein product [Dicrocoelium dendriticum]